MNVTVEISLYPLHDEFEQIVMDYIASLQQQSAIRIMVNGLSTQVIGEYDEVMNILNELNKITLSKYHSVILMKMAAGEKTIENLPPQLKGLK